MKNQHNQSNYQRSFAAANKCVSLAAATIISSYSYAHIPSQHSAPSRSPIVRSEPRVAVRGVSAKTKANREDVSYSAEPSLREKFETLSDDFVSATLFTSSTHEIITNSDHLKIIALGKAVLPLIAEKLKRDEGYWFSALESIADANPVSSDDRGSYGEMKRSWLKFLQQAM